MIIYVSKKIVPIKDIKGFNIFEYRNIIPVNNLIPKNKPTFFKHKHKLVLVFSFPIHRLELKINI